MGAIYNTLLLWADNVVWSLEHLRASHYQRSLINVVIMDIINKLFNDIIYIY